MIGPNLVWQMWHSGLNLLYPLNVALIGLAVIGTGTALFRSSEFQLVSAAVGIILGLLLVYQCWPLLILPLENDMHLSSRWWFVEFHDSYARAFLAVECIVLIIGSIISAITVAEELEQKGKSIQPPEPNIH
jgi:hypothetical protein